MADADLLERAQLLQKAKNIQNAKVGDQSSLMDAELPLVGGTPRGYAKAGLSALPAAGAAVGGAMGFAGGSLAAPGPGSIGGGLMGAGLGGVAGQNLKTLGEQYLLNEQAPTREEYYGGLAKGAKEGVEQEMLAGPISRAGESFAGSGVRDIGQSFNRPGKDAILAAGAKLGVKPTQGMLTDDYVARNLENSLSQSPSVAGSLVRSEQEPISNAVKKSSEKTLADASQRSSFDSGKEMRSGVANTFESRYEPIQKSYEEIEGHTKNIPLNDNGLQRVAKNISNIEEAKFEGSDGHAVAQKFSKWLTEATDANDLKLLKTKARQIAQDPTSSFEEKSVASQIMGKLEKLQSNSITRQAIQIAREAPVDRTGKGKFLNKSQAAVADQEATAEGENIGRKLVGDIKSTNQQYKGLIQDTQKIGEGSGLTKGKHGISAAIEDIKSANPQDMAGALFDSGNVEYTQLVKEKLPKEYELARQQRLSEIAQKSQAPNGEVDPKKLVKIMKSMPPEAQEMLFGKENVGDMEAVHTLLKSTPSKVGGSDTPRGEMFKHILNVPMQVTDMGRYGLLKGKKYFTPAGGLLKQYARPTSGLIKGLVSGED